MPVTERDIAVRAFTLPEWHAAADALFQAAGVTVSVMDFEACVQLAGSHRCGYCHLATDVETPAPLSCFDSCPSPDAGPGRMICRAGLATLYAPVVRKGEAVAHVVLSGFVTSTRERRGLYEHLLVRGVKEDAARRAVKALPVIARRQAEAYLSMAIASATTVLDAHMERVAARERIDELKLFVSAGQQVVSTERLDAGTLGAIAEEAVTLAGGEAGAVLRPAGSVLEVVAKTAEWRGPIGARVPHRSTASGRAAETRRTVVAPGKGGSATLAMPLMQGVRLLGVLEIRMSQELLPLSQDRVARLGRFGQFIAIALDREDERRAAERAMRGYSQLNDLAAALGGQTDVEGIVRLMMLALKDAFSYRVAGLVFSGWNHDRAEIALSGDVARTAIDELLATVTGRDVVADPLGTVHFSPKGGEATDGEDDGEWAIAVADLHYGDLSIGQLFVARGDGEPYCAQDHALLEGIAAHGGSALGRTTLFTRIRDDYAKTIAALSATLDLGERAGSGHATRVMDYAMMIGEELGLGFEAVDQLRFAGLLHDVGKSGIPEEILLKPSRLTADELAQVQKHVEIGATIVDQIEFLKALTPVILHHHERWDGKGYPHGLKGEKIPLLARVLCVADSFDAMTSERAYADRLSVREARRELEAQVGTQFDPRVVAAFLDVLDRMALAGGTGLLAAHTADENSLPA